MAEKRGIMDFTINSKQLASILETLRSVVEKKSSIPALGNVLIEYVLDDTLRMSATDLDHTLSLEVKGVETSEGRLCVGLDRLHSLARALPDTDVAITMLDNHWAKALAGSGTFRIAGIDPENYPVTPSEQAQSYEIEAGDLLVGLANVIQHAGREDHHKFELQGVTFELNGCLRFVASSGFSMGVCDVEPKQSFLKSDKPLSWVIPTKAVNALTSFLDESKPVIFWASDNHLFFRQGGNLLTSRRPAQPGISYEMILKDCPTTELTIDREGLRAALETMACFSPIESGRTRYKAAKFKFSPQGLTVTATSYDGEEAVEEVECSTEGEEFETAMDVFLLRPSLKAAHENARLSVEKDKMLVIRSEESNLKLTQIITQMRL